MKTQSFKQSDIKESWILVDAKDKTLGRLAATLASRLRGKHKPEYSPNADLGDYIVVVNAGEINVTGKKLMQKKYYKHTGYPGGIKSRSLGDVIKNSPEEAIRMAVKGMLPKNKLGKKMLTKLKVYRDNNHPHQAQNPGLIDI
ncbi:MAG: 50S ribosomal protein L13 [SAR86 cluster bacterium]|mgnify:CR=1 FL=1|jgi:large subunit ribosomal protein L13|nr:50S ribosomal protein L13 [SAR86 cluster bacterium]HIC27206.1 50S ribosomal protein L13 [Gammaproteobacteria bacterium]